MPTHHWEYAIMDKGSKSTLKQVGKPAEKTLSESPREQRSASTRQAPESTVDTTITPRGDGPANEITTPQHTPGS